MRSVYMNHRGVEKPVVFKGLVGQYIWWLGGALVVVLLLFAVLYLLGMPLAVCVPVALVLGTAAFFITGRLSRTYGEHGWMKREATRYIPKQIIGAQFK